MTERLEIPSDSQVLQRLVRRVLPVGFVRVDEAMTVLCMNDAFTVFAGIGGIDATGSQLPDTLDVATFAALRPSIVAALEGLATRRELVFASAGAARHVQAEFAPERAADGRVISAVGVLTDITDSKRRESERTLDATTLRDRILAVVAHELRSPLNGVQSWSHVLENQLREGGALPPTMVRALEGIRAGIDQQVALIERLLDATAAMAGEPAIVSGPIVARRVLEAAIDAVSARALDQAVTLHTTIDLADEEIDGDADRVRQIFGELLSNALAFTPRGGRIDVGATRDVDRLVFTIRDSGRGLPAGFDAWLFQPFGQADSAHYGRAGALGLGLAFAQRLVERHRGKISAVSDGPGCGATFTVTLPVSGPSVAGASPSQANGAATDRARIQSRP